MNATTQMVPVAGPAPTLVRTAWASVDFWGRLFITLILACWGTSFVVGFDTALSVLTMVGFATAIVGVFRPVTGLLGIGLLCTLEPLMKSLLFNSDGGVWHYHTFDYWLLLVAVVFARLLLGLNDVRNRLVQVFAVLLGLEVLLSPDWYRGLEDVAGVMGLFGLVVYFIRVVEVTPVWRWLGLVCGTVGAAGGIAFLAQRTSLPPLNANAWASLPLTALFGICLAFPLARPWQRSQVVLVLLASANYALVFLSGSRGALLVATACGLVLVIVAQRMRRRWLVALTVGLVGLAITTQFTEFQTKTVDRINLLLDPQQSLVRRTSGRSELVVAGWHIFLEHPMGVGTGGFAETRVNLVGAAASSWKPQQKVLAHAGWIKILAENGVLGMALMGAYVLSFVVAGWRSRNRDLFMLGLLVTLCFGLGFVSTEYQSKGLWFLAAGVMALLRSDSTLRRQTPIRT